ncbi:MAG: hypothetical protein H5T98_10300 [Syntrophomonadaceae bacterium]|nr:hypothetical protein [Syntrophomonadaceae bacterium]
MEIFKFPAGVAVRAVCVFRVQFSRPGETPGAEVSLSQSLFPGTGKSKKGGESLVIGRPPDRN